MKDLYEFAGMNYGSEQQLQRLLDKNFKFNPFKYRTKVPWRVIEMFDLECSEVLDRLGYTRFKNISHLEDLSQSGFSDYSQWCDLLQVFKHLIIYTIL